jgi:hypothetical protein
MGYRIHTTNHDMVVPSYMAKTGDTGFYFQDEEMDNVEPGIVLEDPGNLEAFVIQGSPEEIRELAMRILSALPVALTQDEQDYLTHLGDTYGYDTDAGSIGRDNEGVAWFESAEDHAGHDLTNQRPRSVD